jgi:hypothetical protein
MNSKRSEIGDEENTSFELRDSVLEDLKPGIDYSEEKREHATEGHHDRFPRRDKKDVPQASLAERIRKEPKGG